MHKGRRTHVRADGPVALSEEALTLDSSYSLSQAGLLGLPNDFSIARKGSSKDFARTEVQMPSLFRI